MDTPLSLGSLPRVGETVDRYEVIAEIASGGMAVVYAVRRKGLGGFDKLLALKLILPHLATEERFVQMLLDEARIASQIHHPNVVSVFDVGDASGTPFMVMEFLRGHSLARVVKKALSEEIQVPPGFTLAVLARAAEGLHAAHETLGPDGDPLGIVHRDVSPQNFHVCYNGQVKVVDFGISAARGKLTMTRTGELKGKLSYLAPEQLTRASVDRRADLWALGVVAWELLAGKRLFRTDEEASTLDNIIRMPVPDLRAYAPNLPHAVYTAVAACLDRNVEHRLASAGALAQVFHESAAALGCPHATDIAGFMDDLFATEKAVEQERLAAAVAGPRPIRGEEPDTGSMPFTPAPHQPTTGSVPQIVPAPVVEPPASPLRHLLWIAPVMGAVILGGSIAWVLSADPAGVSSDGTASAATLGMQQAFETRSGAGTGASPRSPEAPTIADGPPPAEVAEVDATTTITVEVDARARLVLVDGVRVEARPVRIDLGPTDTATVELFYANGDTVRHVVRTTDDGVRLGPEPRATGSQQAGTAGDGRARSGSSSGGSSGRSGSSGSSPASGAGGSGSSWSAVGRGRSTTGSGTTTSGGGGGGGGGAGPSGSTSGRGGSGTGGRRGGGGSPLLGSPY